MPHRFEHWLCTAALSVWLALPGCQRPERACATCEAGDCLISAGARMRAEDRYDVLAQRELREIHRAQHATDEQKQRYRRWRRSVSMGVIVQRPYGEVAYDVDGDAIRKAAWAYITRQLEDESGYRLVHVAKHGRLRVLIYTRPRSIEPFEKDGFKSWLVDKGHTFEVYYDLAERRVVAETRREGSPLWKD